LGTFEVEGKEGAKNRNCALGSLDKQKKKEIIIKISNIKNKRRMRRGKGRERSSGRQRSGNENRGRGIANEKGTKKISILYEITHR
jgi:hypothetical protein